MAYYTSRQCFAYKTLKKQIGQQCTIYQKLHQNGELGSMPGMYTTTEDGRRIPAECTSAFLRGGIITTMACFEAFIRDLLTEARDTILYERKDHSQYSPDKPCEECAKLNYDHVKTKIARNGINEDHKTALNAEEEKWFCDNPTRLHSWEDQFGMSFSLANKTFFEEMCEEGQIVYYYLIDEKHISEIKAGVRKRTSICMLLRLCYGIRCIMAHGNAESTLARTLKDFPHYCKRCKQESDNLLLEHSIKGHEAEKTVKQCEICKVDNATNKLRKISYLSDVFDKCIVQQGKSKVLKTSRKLPIPKPIDRLDDSIEKTNANLIIDEYFKNIHRQLQPGQVLGESYAFFHVCRIYQWLKENKRMMYVTYNMLIRINQLILVLAFRMRVCVAKIMMRDFKLEDMIWGVPKDSERRKDKVERFNGQRKERIKALQKNPAWHETGVQSIRVTKNEHQRTELSITLA